MCRYGAQNNPNRIYLAWCYAYRDETWLTLLTSNDTHELFLKDNFTRSRLLTFHDGGPYQIETSLLICYANQWTSFYMRETSDQRVKTDHVSTNI